MDPGDRCYMMLYDVIASWNVLGRVGTCWDMIVVCLKCLTMCHSISKYLWLQLTRAWVAGLFASGEGLG